MMKNVLDALNSAINKRSSIIVKYNGGSQPGKSREIVPLSIIENKVKARCLTSNTTKQFYIDKIEIVENEINGQIYDATFVAIKETPTLSMDLKNVYDIHNKSWLEMGWHIEIDNDCISLHRIRKNGKPLKGCDASIEYTYEILDYFTGEDNENGDPIAEGKINPKPWCVRGKGLNSIAYKYPEKAVSLFLEYARRLAPIKIVHNDE